MSDTFEIDDEKTDRHLTICPECNRSITPIRSCAPPSLEACDTYTHLCIQATNVWRWCGTFGSLHIDVFKARELATNIQGE